MLILGPSGFDANGFVPLGCSQGPGVGALIGKQKQDVTSFPGANLIRRFRACQPVALWIIPAQALRIGRVVVCVSGRRRSAIEVIVEEDKGGLLSENLIRQRQLLSSGPCTGVCSSMPWWAWPESANAPTDWRSSPETPERWPGCAAPQTRRKAGMWGCVGRPGRRWSGRRTWTSLYCSCIQNNGASGEGSIAVVTSPASCFQGTIRHCCPAPSRTLSSSQDQWTQQTSGPGAAAAQTFPGPQKVAEVQSRSKFGLESS